jgi:hypothetical protein
MNELRFEHAIRKLEIRNLEMDMLRENQKCDLWLKKHSEEWRESDEGKSFIEGCSRRKEELRARLAEARKKESQIVCEIEEVRSSLGLDDLDKDE